MTKEQLLYQLTGTETPRFITERENVMINIFMRILGECEEEKIEYAKTHIEAALKAASKKALINRKATGDGKDSPDVTSSAFDGDIGYEDYVPVEYTIDKESILNSYPLTNLD